MPSGCLWVRAAHCVYCLCREKLHDRICTRVLLPSHLALLPARSFLGHFGNTESSPCGKEPHTHEPGLGACPVLSRAQSQKFQSFPRAKLCPGVPWSRQVTVFLASGGRLFMWTALWDFQPCRRPQNPSSHRGPHAGSCGWPQWGSCLPLSCGPRMLK